MGDQLLNPDAKQVVSVAPDGAISSLRRKDGLDLRQFGKVEIQRVSDIKWDSIHQKWYVKFISGPLEGEFIKRYFDEYEDAIKAEIHFLDAKRRQGIF